MAFTVTKRADYVTGSAGTSFTVPVTPGDLTAGNILFGMATIDYKRITSLPTGWSTTVSAYNGGYMAMWAGWKLITASEPTGYTFSSVDSLRRVAFTLVEISGSATGTPVFASTSNSGYSGSPVGTGITVADANSLIMSMMCADDDSATLGLDAEFVSTISTVGTTGSTTNGAKQITGYYTEASTGATGNYTHTTDDTKAWMTGVYGFSPAPAAGQPVFDNGPGAIDNKAGDTISSGTIDANDWFTPDTGSLTNWLAVTLPAGMSINNSTGLITGTLPTTEGSTECEITVEDDNATPTSGTFTWNYAGYDIVFSGTNRIEDENRDPITSGATIEATVFTGEPDTALTSPQHFTGQTITNGTLTLENITGLDGTYTVLLRNTVGGGVIPLGSYIMVSE